MRDNKTFVLK
ncbi:unnamed protein product, partial [Rotaria sordida]